MCPRDSAPGRLGMRATTAAARVVRTAPQAPTVAVRTGSREPVTRSRAASSTRAAEAWADSWTEQSLFEDYVVYKRGTMAKGCDLFISIYSNHSSSNRTDYPLAIVSAKTKHDGDSLYSIAAPLGKRLAAVVGSTIKTKQKLQVWIKKQSRDLN